MKVRTTWIIEDDSGAAFCTVADGGDDRRTAENTGGQNVHTQEEIEESGFSSSSFAYIRKHVNILATCSRAKVWFLEKDQCNSSLTYLAISVVTG